MIGLISAAQNYKPQKDATFSSYANLRIKGEILDYLRKNSNLCRTTIKMKQNTDKVKEILKQKLGREPNTLSKFQTNLALVKVNFLNGKQHFKLTQLII